MKIRPIDTFNQSDARNFRKFPFQLYQDCPQWVPPASSEMQLVLNRKRHPFYKHSEADFFVAESEGDLLGRIAVLHNQNYSKHHKVATAFFYYFESVEDFDVAAGLFKAAIDWARKRNLQLLLGPKGFLRSNGTGMLVEGFQYPPAMGIPYNLPYYPGFLDRLGFSKETDFLSGYLDKSQQMPPRLEEIVEKVKKRGNFSVKAFTSKSELLQHIQEVERLHYEAFHNNPGFYPSTQEEFELIARTMIQIADPRLIKLIMSGDQIAGFVISYANISNALRQTKGKLWPFGWIPLLLEQKRTKVVDLNGVGFLPKFQGLGGNALLYSEVEKTLRQFKQFQRAELVQVDERNFKSKADMERIGVHWHKLHRVYRYTLDNTN